VDLYHFTLPQLQIQADWSVHEVMDFLETCRSKLGSKVDQYKQVVAENDVDGEVLSDMTDEQLQRHEARRTGVLQYLHSELSLSQPLHYNLPIVPSH
jgi:DNA-directed RNA polymerase subunit N (RpoN/RPB10)